MTFPRLSLQAISAVLMLLSPTLAYASPDLANYAVTYDQLDVARIFDQIGPAAAPGSSLRQDYNRLFVNSANGTANSLQSLLPASGFERDAVVTDFESMESSNIMSHLRALREGATGGMANFSGLRLMEVSPASGIATSGVAGMGAPAPNASETVTTGRMYNPALYVDNANNPSPHAGYQNVNYQTSSALSYPSTSGGYQTSSTLDALSNKIYSSMPTLDQLTQRADTVESRWSRLMTWSSKLSGGHDVDASPINPNLPRTTAVTPLDIANAQQSPYPGQPLGMYNQYVASGGNPDTVHITLPQQHAMVPVLGPASDEGSTQQPVMSGSYQWVPDCCLETVSAGNPAQPPVYGTVAVPVAPAEKPAAINADRRWGTFISGNVSFGSEQLQRNGGSTKVDNTGLTVGVDYRIADRSFVGLALSYAHGSFTTGDYSDVQGDGYAISLYGTTTYLKNAYLDGFITAGYHTFDSERTLFIGNGQTSGASASPDAFHFGGEVETGYNITQDAWKYGPFAGFKLAYATFSPYTENNAGNFNLRVHASDDTSAIGKLGIGGSRRIAMPGTGVLIPAFRVAYNHEFGDGQYNVKSDFVDAPTMPFVTEGARRERNWMSMNPSVMAALDNNWSLLAAYERDVFRYNVNDNTFNLAAKYMW
jgi:uncharacterized protein YhjY with autotransporter beta-barrel domain